MRIATFAAIALLTTPALATAQTAPAPAAAPAAAAEKYTTEDTDIGTLLADPAAKAVLAKYMPDILSNEQIGAASALTLRALQGYAPDKISDETLAKVDADLAKLPVKK